MTVYIMAKINNSNNNNNNNNINCNDYAASN
jgi:hypothetical protein